MKRHAMNHFVFTAVCAWTLLGGACTPKRSNASDLLVAGRQVGGFKGISQIQTILNDRLYGGRNNLGLADILGQELNPLLGAFTEEAATSHFESAAPNPVNILLWEILMDKAAATITEEEPYANTEWSKHNAALDAAFAKLKTPEVDNGLREIWSLVMRYDAPESERAAWLTAVKSEEGILSIETPIERNKNLMQSLLMQPYFLLEH